LFGSNIDPDTSIRNVRLRGGTFASSIGAACRPMRPR
jgi:hypothetical protein